jgi:hypothetical protein
VHQRCWVNKLFQVLNALPKSLRGKAKAYSQASLPGADPQAGQPRLQALHQPLCSHIPVGEQEAGERPRGTTRLRRLPGLALGAPTHHRPHRVHLRDREQPHQSAPELCHPPSFLGLAFAMRKEAAKTSRRSVPTRKWPSCSVEHVTESDRGVRRPQKSNGKRLDPTLPLWSYAGFNNNPHALVQPFLRRAASAWLTRMS